MKNLWMGWVGVLLLALSTAAHSLNIYCEDDAPFQFVGADGKPAGMTVEIVTEIQKRVGNTDPIQMVPWARGLRYLDSEPDTVLFSMSRTAQRNPLYQWVGPIAETVFGFYTQAQSKIEINSLEDAKKVESIGVYRDDVRDQFLTKAGFTNLERANDNVLNFKKLMAGRFVMYAGASNGIKSDAERAGFNVADVKLAYPFLTTQDFLAVSKNTDPAVVAKWNAALESMKKDGSFRAIYRKYFPDHKLPGPAITRFP